MASMAGGSLTFEGKERSLAAVTWMLSRPVMGSSRSCGSSLGSGVVGGLGVGASDSESANWALVSVATISFENISDIVRTLAVPGHYYYYRQERKGVEEFKEFIVWYSVALWQFTSAGLASRL